MRVTPTEGSAGTIVTVSGTGMQPGERVNLRWGSATGSLIGYVTATSTGTYSGQVTVPTTAAAGTHVIFAEGETSNRTAQTDFTVEESAPATLTVRPARARLGETLQITGSGYGPGETVDLVWVWPNTPAGSMTASSTGSLSGQITMNDTGGPLKAVGRTTGATGEASVQWTWWTPTLTTTTTTVSIGQVVSFDGQGYLRGETVKIITTRGDGTHLELARVVATSSGTISGQITIPATGEQRILLDARGLTSDAWASLYLNVSGPTITLSPNEGVPGDIINLTGSGFTPSERVNAYRHHEGTTTTLLGSTDANPDGTVSMPFTFPACSTSTGCYGIVISATGASSEQTGSTMLGLDTSSQSTANRTASPEGTPAVVPAGTPPVVGSPVADPEITPTVEPTTAPATPDDQPEATSPSTPDMTPTEEVIPTPEITATAEPTTAPATPDDQPEATSPSTPDMTPTEEVIPTPEVVPTPTIEPTQAPILYNPVFSIVDNSDGVVTDACVQLYRADGSLAGEWCDASIDGLSDGIYPVNALTEDHYSIHLFALPADVTFVQGQQLWVGNGMETFTVLQVGRNPVAEPIPLSMETPVPTEPPVDAPAEEPPTPPEDTGAPSGEFESTPAGGEGVPAD